MADRGSPAAGWKGRLKSLARLAALLLLAAAGALAWLLTDPAVPPLLLARLPLPPGLTVARAEGRLLDRLTLGDVVYRGDGLTLRIPRLELAWEPAGLLAGRLHLARLAAGEAELEGTAGGSGAVDLPAITPPLPVTLESFRLDRLTLRGRGEVRVVTGIALAATAGGDGIVLKGAEAAGDGWRLTASGRIEPRGRWPLAATLRLRLTLPGRPPLAATAELAGDLQRLALPHLEATMAAARLSASGEVVAPLTAPAVTLAGEWRGLSWPLAAEPAESADSADSAEVASDEGRFTLHGPLAAWRFTLDGAVAGAGLPPGRWRAEGGGNGDGVTIERLEGELLAGRVSGRATLAWSPEPRWQATLAADRLRPEGRWPQWPGVVSLRAEGAGRLAADGALYALALERLDGELRGYPVSGGGTLLRQGERWRLDRLHLASGSAALDAAGTLGDEWALHWSLAAPDLSALLPAAAGTLRAAGELSGPRAAPAVIAELHGQGVRLDDRSVAALDGSAHLDLADRGPSRLDLTARDLRLADTAVATLRITGAGTSRDHRVELTAAGSGGDRLTAAAEGGRAGAGAERWEGRLERAELEAGESVPAGRWRLVAPVPLSVGAAGEVARLCLNDGAARLCGNGEWGEGRWRTAVAAEGLDLARLGPWLAARLPETTLEGAVSGALEASGDGARPTAGTLRLSVGPGTLAYPGPAGEQERLRHRGGRLDARLAAGELRAAATVDLGEAGHGSGELRLPGFPAAPRQAQPLRGTARLEVADLAPLAAFAPGLSGVQGRIDADLSLAGSVAAPRLSGTARLTGGAADLAAQGLHLEPVELTAAGDGDRLRLTGTIGSGSDTGPLRLAGEWRPASGLALDLSGERCLVSDTREAWVVASPALHLTAGAAEARLTGRVVVPEARIRSGPAAGAVTASADVVRADRPRRETRYPLTSEVALRLGEGVEVRVDGFRGEVSGEVRLRGHSGQPTLAEGELAVKEGEYRLYGQRLALDDGRLRFLGGPVENPDLLLTASRTVDEVTARVRVSGPLEAPRVALSSTPTLPQSDILSYLLLGHPANQGGDEGAALLLQAAVGLVTEGGDPLTDRVAHGLGLDEARFEDAEPGSKGGGALVLGKYLSPELFIGYSAALREGSSGVELRYRLGKQWEIKTRTGSQTSADILYTIER